MTDPKTTEIQEAMAWIIGRDTGASSKAIMARLLGAPAQPMSYPHDPDDLGRCLRLLSRIPAWSGRISEMADCGDEWKRLVARWGDIERAMISEVGIKWEKGRSAPKTYALMQDVIYGR